MKIFYFLLLVMVCHADAFSQKMKVIDITVNQPIAGVVISANSGTAVTTTDINGMADISSFKGSDSLFFEHVGYLPALFSYNQIAANNFVIALSERVFSMDQVVISASKFDEKSRDIAQSVHLIKSKDLTFMNQPTTADVLQNSGAVLVQKSQLGGGSPIIRGFETNKVLMVVDGVRMNNAIYRGGHLQNVITLDNAVLDKVELLFGPASAVYGSDALGGVMHFYTKNPELSTDDQLRVKANGFVRYSSAMQENTGHIDISLGGKRFASLTSISHSDFGDLRQGNLRNPFYGDWGKRTFYAERIDGKDSMIVNKDINLQVGSAYKQVDFLQKFLFKQSDKIQHVINLQYSTSNDIPRYDRLVLMQGNLPRFAQWYYGPQERVFASYTLDLKSKTLLFDEARVIAGFQSIEESRHDRRFNNVNLNHRKENVLVATFNADFLKKVNEHEIRYGADAWYNDVASSANKENIVTGERSPIDTRYPDGGSQMQSAALYLTHAWEISPKLILNDGVRVNHVSLNSKFNDKTFFPFPFDAVSQKNTALTGNLGLVYMPGKDWRFVLSGATGFRAPNVDDLSKVFESVPGRITIPNPDIKPERTWNLDAGISKSWNDRVVLGGTAYYTQYKNAIVVRPSVYNGQDSIEYNGLLSAVNTTTNAGEAYIYGFNLYLNADVNEYFSVTSSVNYTYGRIKTDTADYPLDHIPPVFGKTGLNLRLNKFRSEFFVIYNSAKLSRDYNLLGEDNQAYSADPVKGYMPAWVTLNVRCQYQLNKSVGLQVALENILDQNYRVYASNISAPGRNLIVTLRGTI